MRFKIAATRALAALAASLTPLVANAHHSMAMFDQQHEMVIAGTVREFQWTNPHAYIQLIAKDDQGRDVEWSLELGAPMYLYARGWRPRTLRPGSEVKVRIYPLRNGRAGGVVLDVEDADGKPIGTNQ